MNHLRIPSRPFFTALVCLAALACLPAARADSPAGNTTSGNTTSGNLTGNTSTTSQPAPKVTKNPVVIIDTSMGPIVVEIFADKAPISAANFLQYVDSGFYNGTIFHRVIPAFMIQGGGFTPDLTQKPTLAPIKNEAGNGLTNDTGTLAMARTSVVDSATSQFFINVQDNPFLNHTDDSPQGYGYAVFGKVVNGMDVVKKIEIVPTGDGSNGMGNVPLTPVIIKSIKRQ